MSFEIPKDLLINFRSIQKQLQALPKHLHTYSLMLEKFIQLMAHVEKQHLVEFHKNFKTNIFFVTDILIDQFKIKSEKIEYAFTHNTVIRTFGDRALKPIDFDIQSIWTIDYLKIVKIHMDTIFIAINNLTKKYKNELADNVEQYIFSFEQTNIIIDSIIELVAKYYDDFKRFIMHVNGYSIYLSLPPEGKK